MKDFPSSSLQCFHLASCRMSFLKSQRQKALGNILQSSPRGCITRDILFDLSQEWELDHRNLCWGLWLLSCNCAVIHLRPLHLGWISLPEHHVHEYGQCAVPGGCGNFSYTSLHLSSFPCILSLSMYTTDRLEHACNDRTMLDDSEVREFASSVLQRN